MNSFLYNTRAYLLYAGLFIITFFTTTLGGVQWLNKNPLELSNFPAGLPYSIAIMTFLSFHEFGHFFAGRIHKISTTLPFFIPTPPFLINPFGTMGAVIRIRSPFPSRRALFDVGIAGPIAGFIITLIVLLIGFITLPGKEYLFTIHPEYATENAIPENGFAFGNSILFWAFCKIFSAHAFVPPMNEIYHYPFLCVGWFGLFVTALNLLPIGQLDGGHILYALFGAKIQSRVARIFWLILIVIGLTGLIPLFGGSIQFGTLGWLLWAIILFFVIKLDHIPLFFSDELTSGRKILGWIGIFIFIISFPPIPFYG